MTRKSSFLLSLVLCSWLCAPQVLAQQKSVAEEQKARREAAERKSQEMQQQRNPPSQPQQHHRHGHGHDVIKSGDKGHSTATAATCRAHPVCREPTGGNKPHSCQGVQQAYNGTGAAQIGMQDILQRCRAMNAGDSCCAAQCEAAARCFENR